MSSLSDSCSMLVFQYYENIVEAAKKDLTPDSVCHVTGQCAYKYHQHDEYDFPEDTADECLHLAEQYYPLIYEFLTKGLNPAEVCGLMGLCSVAHARGSAAEQGCLLLRVLPALPAGRAQRHQHHPLGLCPQESEVRLAVHNSDTSRCPLCLFAVEQLKAMLKDDRSEDEVHDPLKLTHNNIDKFFEKPQLRGDRNNFRGHSMLTKQFDIGKHFTRYSGTSLLFLIVETNEIPDNTVNGHPVSAPRTPPKTVCVVCEFVMKELDEQIKDKHNDDEIMNAVHNICKHMPKSVRGECDQFVQKYGELVISLLAQELEPAKICEELKLCPKDGGITAMKAEEILDCAVCETAVMAVKKVLANDKVDRNIVKVVEKSCALLPAKYSARVSSYIRYYSAQVR
ncbi:Saposin [Operophtera brumata]|uniref:Saposin n=1 Tax=Operophtera brumata TaxID=104452 RepID=A0A0L7L196_OPEBR|nr:Saposin [Operophtera brumata]